MKRRRLGIPVAAALVLGLALVGCSGESEASPDDEVRTFVTAVADNPATLNRYLSSSPGVKAILSGTVYEGLTRMDEDYNVLPWLAKSWDISADNLTYTFQLEEGVTWQDGEPFTSADVKFTMEELMPLSQLTAFVSSIDSIETPDDTTVVVHFATPYAAFLAALSSAHMMPEHIFTTDDLTTDPANMEPVGTGPYAFDSFRSGDQIVLTRYDNYWGTKGEANRVIFKVMPDANARLLGLESGEVDFINGNYVDQQQLDQLDDDTFSKPPLIGTKATINTFFNTTRPQLADPEVRRAIYQAIDKEAIVERAFYGAADVARGPVPAVFQSLVTRTVNFPEDLPYDPEAAAEALDDAGYPADANGQRFGLTLIFQPSFSVDANTADLIKANLSEVGIEVTLEGLDPQVFAARTFQEMAFDMSLQGFASFEDPSIGVSRLYLCNPDRLTYRNASGYCDDIIEENLIQASRVADPAERAELFAAAEERILEMMPSMPLVVNNQFDVYNATKWDMSGVTAVNPPAFDQLVAVQ